jgi:hypothetical protein
MGSQKGSENLRAIMKWGRVARLMQSIKEPRWAKNHTKEIKRHRSLPDIYASKMLINTPGLSEAE